MFVNFVNKMLPSGIKAVQISSVLISKHIKCYMLWYPDFLCPAIEFYSKFRLWIIESGFLMFRYAELRKPGYQCNAFSSLSLSLSLSLSHTHTHTHTNLMITNRSIFTRAVLLVSFVKSAPNVRSFKSQCTASLGGSDKLGYDIWGPVKVRRTNKRT